MILVIITQKINVITNLTNDIANVLLESPKYNRTSAGIFANDACKQ
ncbi:hypothetical protein GCM10008920_17450 [Pediococcus acidilactici]|nr:hypothetical protein GCM10008920_17450 [Pediococcus acidilactici]